MTEPRGAKREVSAGGVVFRCFSEGPKFLLINDAYSNWGFPKGHLDDSEVPEEAARREVGEETGLTELTELGALGVIDWFFRFRGQLIHKYCHFFLFESPAGSPVPQLEEGITACRWYPYADAVRNISYENARTILRRAGAEVSKRRSEAGSAD
ncbi:MAG: NUDIX hydrolase [Gemmatimonadales bacterium]